jgi:hypothetical protein
MKMRGEEKSIVGKRRLRESAEQGTCRTSDLTTAPADMRLRAEGKVMLRCDKPRLQQNGSCHVYLLASFGL